VERFADSDHAAEVFGEEYRDVLVAVKNDEVQTLTSLITPVEYRYYLSRL
jgi:glutamine synthetase